MRVNYKKQAKSNYNIKSSIIFKNEVFKSLTGSYIKKIKSNEKLFSNGNKEFKILFNKKNRMNVKETKERITFVNGRLIFFYLIDLLVISNIFESNSQNLIISKDSIITLRVSKSGMQKIYYDSICFDTEISKPSKVFIDENEKNPPNHSYDLHPGNIISLIWNYPISECGCMFMTCESIVEINFTDFDTSQCNDMVSMFKGCKSLTSLDLSSFDTSSVTNMSDMFHDCNSLVSLNITNFDTSSVTRGMGHMFTNCNSLVSINISSFNTSQIEVMDYMFDGCYNLTSINLSNFNTSKVTKFENMFNDCQSLNILDFQNLDIKSVQAIDNMQNIFLNCNNLKYINIKNFQSNNLLGSDFFSGSSPYLVICIDDKLSINQIIEENTCMVINCDENWYDFRKKINTQDGSCVEFCNLTSFQYEYEYKCYPECLNRTYNDNYKCEDCHSDCEECEGPYNSNNSNCIRCISSEKYLNYGNCVNNCSRGYFINEANKQKTCKCELKQCFTCSIDSLVKELCTTCEKGYYPIYNDSYNSYHPYYNCSQSPEGYYLDNETLVYKLCYSSCKTCNISGNVEEHNCIECKNDYYFENQLGLYKNCYDNCSHYHYFDENQNKTFCTNNSECPEYYDKLIEEKRECVFNCSNDEHYKYEFQKSCFKECPSNSTKRELDKESTDKYYFCKPICGEESPFEIIDKQKCVKNCGIKSILNKSCILNFQDKENIDSVKTFDILLKTIETGFTSNDYDTSGLEEGINDIIEYKQMIITLTTTKNQKNDENNENVTAINLGKCEGLLKEAYNINPNDILYMKKIDVYETGMKIPKVEYDVYHKLNGSKLVKLNISYCTYSKIDISVPAIINENIDKLNSSSEYYNNLCYPATSDSGSDIILKDRKTEFIENNRTVCQENCVFAEYDNKNKKTKCTCDIEVSSSSFIYIKINKTKLIKDFIDIRNIANINILICYDVLFSKKGISKNYGSYSLIPMIVIHFILLILFYTKHSYNQIKDKIINISFNIDNLGLLKTEENKKEKRLKRMKTRNEKIKKMKGLNTNFNKDKKSNSIKGIKINISENSKENPPIKKKRKTKKNKTLLNYDEERKDTSNIPKNTNKNKFNKNSDSNKMNKEMVAKIKLYNDEELNNLSYKLAIKMDKRNYCQYYISLLKTKHSIMFTFFNNNDYNSKIIKIDLFLLDFTLFYTINALFFSDNTMHKIYKDKGSYNFLYQLPQIIYSSLISAIIGFLLNMLALTQDSMLKLKKLKKKKNKNFNKKIIKLDNKIKIKFILYFILSSIILIFFWYYLSMFCAIYVNTQIHLIKDTFISYALSFIYPFGIYLIPGIFRILALSNHKEKRKILYKFSKILQVF